MGPSGTPHHPLSTPLSDGVVATVRDLRTKVFSLDLERSQPNEGSEVSSILFPLATAIRQK